MSDQFFISTTCVRGRSRPLLRDPSHEIWWTLVRSWPFAPCNSCWLWRDRLIRALSTRTLPLLAVGSTRLRIGYWLGTVRILRRLLSFVGGSTHGRAPDPGL